jgi:hypothetical protein
MGFLGGKGDDDDDGGCDYARARQHPRSLTHPAMQAGCAIVILTGAMPLAKPAWVTRRVALAVPARPLLVLSA